jgi:hypothetical protein
LHDFLEPFSNWNPATYAAALGFMERNHSQNLTGWNKEHHHGRGSAPCEEAKT